MTNSTTSNSNSSSKKASKPNNKNKNGNSAANNANSGASSNGQPKQRRSKQKKRDDTNESVEKMLYPDMFDKNNKLIPRPVTAPSAPSAPMDGTGYAGSSFHESPAASSLPRPAFRGNTSPRQPQQVQGAMSSGGFQSPPPAMPMQTASPPGVSPFGGPMPGYMGHAPPMYGYGMPMGMPMAGMPMPPAGYPGASPHMYAMPNMHGPAAAGAPPYGMPHPQSATHYNYPPMASSANVPMSPHSRTAQQA